MNKLKHSYFHTHIGFFSNIVNENTRPEFYNFASITKNFSNRMNYDNNISINHKIVYTNIITLTVGAGIFEHLFSVNQGATLNGIGITADHLYEMDVEFDLMGNIISISNINICQRSKLVSKRKRDNNGCTNPTKISFDNNIKLNTINIVELFKEKDMDKNLLPYYNNIEDISNSKSLHNNAEKITDVWKFLSQSYDINLNKLTKEESSSYIIGFYHTINQYKRLLAKYESSNSFLLINFDENDIKEMESYFNNNFESHIRNFGDIFLTDTYNTDSINDIKDNDYDTEYEENSENEDFYNENYGEISVNGVIGKYNISNEPGSKNNLLKLINCFENLISIVNLYDGNLMYGLGVLIKEGKISSIIDHNTIVSGSKDLLDATNKLSEQIKSLDMNKLDDIQKETLLHTYNNLHDILNEHIKEYNNGNLSSNTEIICNLHNAIANKIGKEEYTFNNFLDSQNVLYHPDLVALENNDAFNVIKNGNISAESKALVLKGVENNIKSSNNKYINKNTYNFIKNAKQYIDQQGKQITSLKNYKGNELRILNHVYLASNFNDLIATAICHGKIYSEDLNNNIPISTVEFDNELDNRVKYLINVNFNNAISKIAQNNQNKYNINAKFSKDGTVKWNSNTSPILSENSLINMYYDNTNINNKADVYSNLIKDTNNDMESKKLLRFSNELHYQYINYQSTASINSENSNILSLHYNKLSNKLPKNIQSLEEFQNESFSKAMDRVVLYNPNVASKLEENSEIKTDELFKEMIEYDNNIENSMDENTKNLMEESTKEFSKYISGTYYKFSKLAGRETQNTYNVFSNNLNKNLNYAYSYISNNFNILNNKESIMVINPNFNSINIIHNNGIVTNDVTKKSNKNIILKYKKNTLNAIGKKG